MKIRAEALGDLESQAAAYVGLWRAWGREEYLEQALGLYEKLGDEEAVEALNKRLALEQSPSAHYKACAIKPGVLYLQNETPRSSEGLARTTVLLSPSRGDMLAQSRRLGKWAAFCYTASTLRLEST